MLREEALPSANDYVFKYVILQTIISLFLMGKRFGETFSPFGAGKHFLRRLGHK